MESPTGVLTSQVMMRNCPVKMRLGEDTAYHPTPLSVDANGMVLPPLQPFSLALFAS